MSWHSAAEAPPPGAILAWHALQGARVEAGETFARNRCHTHWMEIPPGGWTDSARPPTQADADEYNCVLAWDRYDGAKITGWHQIRAGGSLVRWMRTPAPPPGHRALRRRYMLD